MYHILKKHKKRLLAFATAFLMVAFLLPTVGRQTGSGDTAVGKVYGKKVYVSERRQAEHEWQLLRSRIMVRQGYQYLPLANLLTQSPVAVVQMEQHPELFMLLLEEAHKQGVVVQDDRVDELLREVQTRDVDMTSLDSVEAVRHAIQSFLLVRDSFDRAMSAIRISAPQRTYELATGYQSLKLNAVDIAAESFASKVPAPTQEQLQAFFDKYKEIDAEKVDLESKTNPFGFGYRFPDRVALQYVMVSPEELRRVVQASQSDYDWQVEARRYYLQNQARFTVPTTQAGLDISGLNLNKPIATTQPFDAVAKDALEAVMQPKIQKLQGQVLSRINSLLVDDWNTYRQAKSGEKVGSSLGVAYNSYEYLQKVAADIAKLYKVTVTIEQYPKLLGASDLTLKGQIARAATNSGLPFPAYATMTDESRKAALRDNPGLPPVLALWQPSQTLRSMTGISFVFRVTERSPAHTPKTMAEAGVERVTKDYISEQAMILATKEGASFVESAAKQGFFNAASAAKKNVVDTGFISPMQPVAMGLHLTDQENSVFINQATKTLLEMRGAGEAKPVAAIAVPRGGRVIVAQLDQVREGWTPEQLPLAELQVTRRATYEMVGKMEEQWFRYPNVVARTSYESSEPRKSSSSDDSDKPAAPSPTPLGM